MNVETKPGMLWIDRMGDRRSWAILVRFFSVENWAQAQRKKKEAKKKENGGLWKLTPLMEIRSQRGFPQRLGKHKTLSTVPTRPDGGSTDLIHQQGGAKSNDQKGPNQVDGRRKSWAVINYGWESQEFYRKWAKAPASDRSEWQGPELDPLNVQGPYAPALLDLFKWVLESPGYVERLKKHYQLFREAVDKEYAMGEAATSEGLAQE